MPQDEAKEAARRVLQAHFPTSSTTAATRRAPNTAKLGIPKTVKMRQVELMKLRHHAQPGDPKDRTASVSVADRIHVTILAEGTNTCLWFRKVRTAMAGTASF